jgi:hypothetical protein
VSKSKRPKLYEWRIVRPRSSPAAFVGYVKAPDAAGNRKLVRCGDRVLAPLAVHNSMDSLDGLDSTSPFQEMRVVIEVWTGWTVWTALALY